METITLIWLRDAEFGNTVARLSWVTDGVSDSERSSLDALASAHEADPETANLALSMALAKPDLGLAILVAGSEWFADGVDHDDPYGSEESAIKSLNDIAERSPELSRAVSGLLWIADDMTVNESGALRYIAGLAKNDLELAILVARLPWLADVVSTHETTAIEDLARMASQDVEMAKSMSSWVLEGLSPLTAWSLRQIAEIASIDLRLARQVINLIGTPIEDIEDRERYFLDSLFGIAQTRPDDLRELVSRSWFTDGLSDEEIAFVAALRGVGSQYPEQLYKSLLQSRFTQSKAITLPLAGDVSIWAFQDIPFPPDEDVVDVMEQAARALEEFTGVPFPTTDIIGLIIVKRPNGDYSLGYEGLYLGSHVLLNRDKPDLPVSRRTVYHEIGHYYLNRGPAWLVEGGANFMAAYISHRTGWERLEDRRPEVSADVQTNCAEFIGVNNLQQLSDFQPDFQRQYNRIHQCNFNLGEFFLMSLFDGLGEDVVGAALGELHLLSLHEGPSVTEEQIYRVFLRNTPLELEEALLELYRRVHGGLFLSSMPDKVPTVSIPGLVVREILKFLPWAASPPDADHARALKSIADLWQLEAELGAAVAQSGWLIDGASRIESAAVSDILDRSQMRIWSSVGSFQVICG